MHEVRKLKLLYYLGSFVMLLLCLLLLMALIGSLVGMHRGENVPPFIPIVFGALLLMFAYTPYVNGFFYVLRNVHRYSVVMRGFYEVECLRRIGLGVREIKGFGKVRRYEVCGSRACIILIPLHIYIPPIFRGSSCPAVQQVMLHLIPRSIDKEELLRIETIIRECSGDVS